VAEAHCSFVVTALPAMSVRFVGAGIFHPWQCGGPDLPDGLAGCHSFGAIDADLSSAECGERTGPALPRDQGRDTQTAQHGSQPSASALAVDVLARVRNGLPGPGGIIVNQQPWSAAEVAMNRAG